MPRQVEPLQRFEGLVAVLVDENAGVAGFLPRILDLQLVPGGVAGDEDPCCSRQAGDHAAKPVS
jgi:hypothetical protein